MTVDPNIQQKADYIRRQKEGLKVRESLASGLEAMSSDVVENKSRQNTVEDQFQQVIDETTGKDIVSAPEIIAARNGEPNLKSRLDKEKQEVTAQLAQTAKELGVTEIFRPDIVSAMLKMKTEFEERDINILWYSQHVPNKNEDRELWDWTLAIQTAMDDLLSNGGGTIKFPAGIYRYSRLNYYSDAVTLASEMGAELWTTSTTGYAITMRAGKSRNVKDYLQKAHTHKIIGLTFRAIEPGAYHFQSNGDTDGELFASAWTFENCSFRDTHAVEIFNATWCAKFDRCYFDLARNKGIVMPAGGRNYGEKISIENCIFDRCDPAIHNGNGEGDIRLVNTSIDYCQVAVESRAGVVSLTECFIESSVDTTWFDVRGYGANLHITTAQIVDMYDGDRQNPIFYCDSNVNLTGAGITIDHIKLTLGRGTADFLVGGGGRTVIRGVDTYFDSHKPMLSRFMNNIAFGNCEDSKSINEFDPHRFTAIRPTITTSEKYQGNASKQYAIQEDGQRTGDQITLPTKPGEMIRAFFRIKTSGLSDSKKFIVERRFLDRNKNQISSGSLYTANKTISDWETVKLIPPIDTPAGTHFVEFSFWGGSWTTDTRVWLDDIVFNVLN